MHTFTFLWVCLVCWKMRVSNSCHKDKASLLLNAKKCLGALWNACVHFPTNTQTRTQIIEALYILCFNIPLFALVSNFCGYSFIYYLCKRYSYSSLFPPPSVDLIPLLNVMRLMYVKNKKCKLHARKIICTYIVMFIVHAWWWWR